MPLFIIMLFLYHDETQNNGAFEDLRVNKLPFYLDYVILAFFNFLTKLISFFAPKDNSCMIDMCCKPYRVPFCTLLNLGFHIVMMVCSLHGIIYTMCPHSRELTPQE